MPITATSASASVADDGDGGGISGEEEMEYDEEIIEEVEDGEEEGEEIIIEEVEIIEEEEEEEEVGRVGEEKKEEEKGGGGGEKGRGEGEAGHGGRPLEDCNDVSGGVEREGNDSRLRSCSAPEIGASSLGNRTCEERNCSLGTALPSYGPARQRTEKFESTDNDSSMKFGEHQSSPKDVGGPEASIDKNGDGIHLEKKAPSLCSEFSSESHAFLDSAESIQNKEVVLFQNHGSSGKKVFGAPCSERDKHVDSRSEDGKQMASRVRPRSLSPGVELFQGNKLPAIICDFFAKGWCIKGSSCRFLHIKDHAKNVPELAERETTAARGKTEAKLGQGPKDDFDRHQGKQPSSFALTVEDQVTNLISNSSHLISQPLNSSVKPPFTSRILTSQIPARAGSSRTLNSNSEISSPLDAQNILDINYAAYRSSSLLRSSAHLSSSEPENFAQTSVDPPPGPGNRRKFSSYDWQPSEPFRPSFFLSPTIVAPPGSRYDPFCDSTEKLKTRDRHFRLSSTSQGASFCGATDQHSNCDLEEKLVGKCANDNYSSPARFNEHVGDKDCLSHGRDVPTSAAETAENSVVNSQNENVMSKENDQQSENTNDGSNYGGNSTDLRSGLKNDLTRHKKDLKSDKLSQDIQMDVTQKKDEDTTKEPKALRHFRVALIDFVKELLKPTWHEGCLSKDAHNMIVKKAVDKVINTLLPQQIPPNMESIRQYLSFSHSKLAKLVEGYVDKYGKR